MKTTDRSALRTKIFRNIVPAVFWIALIIVCLIYKDRITVENIVNFTPENPVLAAVIILCLFVFKSLTFFLFSGILDAVSGILFPLPAALLVNIAGTALMVSVPYLIGKKKGQNLLAELVNKYPKLGMLRSFPNRNGFLFSFLIRIFGCLPLDAVSMYLGASGVRYGRYALGSVIGLLPMVVMYTVMGMSCDDVTSPAFVISLCCELLLMLSSVVIVFVWGIRAKKQKQ